jgi:hypothetical protein
MGGGLLPKNQKVRTQKLCQKNDVCKLTSSYHTLPPRAKYTSASLPRLRSSAGPRPTPGFATASSPDPPKL